MLLIIDSGMIRDNNLLELFNEIDLDEQIKKNNYDKGIQRENKMVK